MAKYDSTDVGFMLLGGYSLLGATTKIEDVVSKETRESMSLGDAEEAYALTGRTKTEMTQGGWFDDETNSIHEALKTLPVASLPLSIAPHGNINAARFDGYTGVYRVGYKVQMEVSELHKANGEYGIWSAKKVGYIVHAVGAEGAAGNTDTLDVYIGPGPFTNGGTVWCHIIALSGCTNASVTLRHSTDGIAAYADKVTAATAITPAMVPAQSGVIATFTGTLNNYVSAAWAYTSATTPSITFMLGVYPNP